jgi:hypothetical protein
MSATCSIPVWPRSKVTAAAIASNAPRIMCGSLSSPAESPVPG